MFLSLSYTIIFYYLLLSDSQKTFFGLTVKQIIVYIPQNNKKGTEK